MGIRELDCSVIVCRMPTFNVRIMGSDTHIVRLPSSGCAAKSSSIIRVHCSSRRNDTAKTPSQQHTLTLSTLSSLSRMCFQKAIKVSEVLSLLGPEPNRQSHQHLYQRVISSSSHQSQVFPNKGLRRPCVSQTYGGCALNLPVLQISNSAANQRRARQHGCATDTNFRSYPYQ